MKGTPLPLFLFLSILGTFFSNCGPKKAEGIWSAKVQEPLLQNYPFYCGWQVTTNSRSGTEGNFPEDCSKSTMFSSVFFSLWPSVVNNEGPRSVPTAQNLECHPQAMWWCPMVHRDTPGLLIHQIHIVISGFAPLGLELGFEDLKLPKFYIWGEISNSGELIKQIS